MTAGATDEVAHGEQEVITTTTEQPNGFGQRAKAWLLTMYAAVYPEADPGASGCPPGSVGASGDKKRKGLPVSLDAPANKRPKEDADGNLPRKTDMATRFPEELLEEIISMLKFSDVRSVSRVCRKFHRIAEPFLWKVVNIDLRNGAKQSLDTTQIESQRNKAIIKYINDWTRNLTFTISEGDRPEPDGVPELFPSFIHGIRFAKLHTLRVIRSDLEAPSWVALNQVLNSSTDLNMLPAIREVHFPSFTREKKLFDSGAYRLTSRCKVRWQFQSKGVGEDRTITLHTNDLSTDQYEVIFSFMIRLGFCGRFQHVTVTAASDGVCKGIFDMLVPHYKIRTISITTLHLSNIKLLCFTGFGRMNFQSLKELSLVDCSDIDFLLEVPGFPAPNLERFICVNPIERLLTSTTRAIPALLMSMSGLKKLHINAAEKWAFGAAALANHKTLQELTLRFGNTGFGYRQIEGIRLQCPELKSLGIQLSQGDYILRWGKPGRLFDHNMVPQAQQLVLFESLENLAVYMSRIDTVLVTVGRGSSSFKSRQNLTSKVINEITTTEQHRAGIAPRVWKVNVHVERPY